MSEAGHPVEDLGESDTIKTDEPRTINAYCEHDWSNRPVYSSEVLSRKDNASKNIGDPPDLVTTEEQEKTAGARERTTGT